jgi:hypothetical protein
MISITVRLQGSFDPKDMTFRSRLEQQENIVWDAITKIAAEAAPLSAVTPAARALITTDCTAVLDTIQPIDPTAGVICNFPAACAANAGHSIWICRRAAGALSLQCPGGSTIADAVPVAVGMYRFLSDGATWWLVR